MIDGYHRRIYRRSLERTVILMELAELWNIHTFICHLWKTFMRFSNVPMGHVRLLRRIRPIRPSYNPCPSCSTCATYATSRMRVSASNFSGYSSYFAPIQPFSAVSHTSRSFMRVFLTDSCYVGKHALHYPFRPSKTESYLPHLLITRMWCTEIKLDEYITPNTSCVLREMRNTAIREAHEFTNKTFWIP